MDTNVISCQAMHTSDIHVEVEDTFSIIENCIPAIHIMPLHVAHLVTVVKTVCPKHIWHNPSANQVPTTTNRTNDWLHQHEEHTKKEKATTPTYHFYQNAVKSVATWFKCSREGYPSLLTSSCVPEVDQKFPEMSVDGVVFECFLPLNWMAQQMKLILYRLLRLRVMCPCKPKLIMTCLLTRLCLNPPKSWQKLEIYLVSSQSNQRPVFQSYEVNSCAIHSPTSASHVPIKWHLAPIIFQSRNMMKH